MRLQFHRPRLGSYVPSLIDLGMNMFLCTKLYCFTLSETKVMLTCHLALTDTCAFPQKHSLNTLICQIPFFHTPFDPLHSLKSTSVSSPSVTRSIFEHLTGILPSHVLFRCPYHTLYIIY